MPAKMRKSRMAMPIQKAENIDMKETWFSVRGSDIIMPIRVVMTEKITVQREWSERVLRTLAPVKTWNPIRIMLLARSMKAVNS